jgi:hypothetical protein
VRPCWRLAPWLLPVSSNIRLTIVSNLILAEAEQADHVTADTRLVGKVQATPWSSGRSAYPNMTSAMVENAWSFFIPSAESSGGGSGLFERLDALLLFSPEEAQIHDVRACSSSRATRSRRAEHYDRSAEFPWRDAASSG